MKVLQSFTVVCNLTPFGGLVERATVDVCITNSICGSGARLASLRSCRRWRSKLSKEQMYTPCCRGLVPAAGQ